MSLMLKGRHVQVNREKYIRSLVKRFYGKLPVNEQNTLFEKALSETPLSILDSQQLQKAYKKLCWHYGRIVFAVSFLTTTVPDNIWCVILAAATDLYVFQCVTFRAMQKIMMLYGKPIDLNADANSGIDMILSVDRSGVMIGKHPLLQKLKSGFGSLAKQVVKKQGPKLISKMSKSVFVIVRRQFIKWFSLTIAKENVTMVLELLIPVTCAIISGIVSVIILIPMCNKLRKNITENSPKNP